MLKITYTYRNAKDELETSTFMCDSITISVGQNCLMNMLFIEQVDGDPRNGIPIRGVSRIYNYDAERVDPPTKPN